mgnify:FL=1
MTDYAKFLHSNRSDEQYTPRYAVLPIIKYLPASAVVWCPFDTSHSEFVLALEEQGFKVVYSHLLTGQDFFEYEPDYWDVLVSNPPFSNKKEVFKRCLSFRKPFALLMSNFWLNNTAPYKLFKDRELELMFFDKRVQYNSRNSVPFGSSYVCHKVLPKQIVFENLTTDKSLSRMYGEIQQIMGKVT